ncbi:MAG: RNA 2',3'-cyclic phosphodiesterase [Thermoplasmata archaeon]|nr:RNA 2',3'-cyclic phosphodiesterase [Thermoplasmata archaeon]
MRAFASLPIPSGELHGLPAPIESHLTLRFWAELDVGRLPSVFAALDAVALRTAPFRLELRGIGAFPSVERPRVVWVGLGRGAVEVGELHRALTEAFTARGEVADPRGFSPHVTLFRVRSEGGVRRARAALELGEERSFGEVAMDRVELYSSRLEPDGAVHERLHSAPLSAGGKHLPAEPHA